MSSDFSLPSSSYSELCKIIIGYSHSKADVTLDDLAQLTGINKTIISKNNKFLSELGLIKGVKGGRMKSPTSLGTKLGRALGHSQQSNISESWLDAIRRNETFSQLEGTIRIQGGMSEEKFTAHILYASGQKKTSVNRTGAKTISDILITSGLLEQQDGQFQIAKSITDIPEESEEPAEHTEEPLKDENVNDSSKERGTSAKQNPALIAGPTIAINVQLQLPETEKAEVYENLFKALRKHLLSPGE